MSSLPLGAHAVVIGAGMGGLTAAAAISEHFEQVTVLDRDALPSEPGHRVGTPQDRHLHVLLAGGLRSLCELLVGFEDDLVKAGAVPPVHLARIAERRLWDLASEHVKFCSGSNASDRPRE